MAQAVLHARRVVAVGLIYGAAVELGLALKVPGVDIAMFWPAAGVGATLMVLALRRSRAQAASVALAIAGLNLLLNLVGHNTLAMSAGYTVANTVEPLVAGLAYARLRRTRTAPAMTMPCLIVAALAGVLPSSALAVGLLRGGGEPWWQTAANFGVPDFSSIVVVGSLIVVPHRLDLRRWPEATAQAGVLAALCAVAYWFTTGLHVGWLPLPALMWAAMRLGTTWTAVSSSGLAVTVAVAASHNRGAFGDSAHRFTDLIASQGFATVAVFMAMTMAAVVVEREQAARALALSDPLTGVGNRRYLVEQAPQLLGGGRHEGTLVGLFFCDLNGFKAINDAHGHEAGDEVLRQVAQRLAAVVRRSDVVARLGGDEFVVLCPDIYAASEVEKIAARLEAVLTEPILVGGRTLAVTASVGVAMQTRPTSLPELMARADAEMYRNKSTGRPSALPPVPRGGAEIDPVAMTASRMATSTTVAATATATVERRRLPGRSPR